MSKYTKSQDFILRIDSCLTPSARIHNACILCRDGTIQALGGYSALKEFEDIPCIDMSHCHAIPGLVDTHLHGTGGFDAMGADTENGLAGISAVLARHGVTSFVITVLSAATDKMLEVIEALAKAHEEEHPGAVPVGIHIEGPYLNHEKAGAQSEMAIRPVDLGEAEELVKAGSGRVKTMTFAPELKHSEELVRLLVANGVMPSMGHSMAAEEHVLRAVSAGAMRCTHLFNGMPPLSQRDVGLTSVALTDDRLTIELTADGFHVHPRMIDLACRIKPAAGVVGISDATQGAGLEDGFYHLGGDSVCISKGVCRRVSDGKLAGSCLTLDSAMRNLAEFSSLSEQQVVACYTRNAAISVGLMDRGEIQPGRRADIAVVDENWNVQMTVVNGNIVFDARA